MARKRTMGIYMDTFCYDSDIELRKDNTTYQHIASFPVCPEMKVIPQIWRNGFDGAFHGIEPLTLFKAMLTDHRIETMMKQCRYGHVRHFIDHPRHLKTCWNAYKIANRNHYLITDIGKWADYICMLVEWARTSEVHITFVSTTLKPSTTEYPRNQSQERKGTHRGGDTKGIEERGQVQGNEEPFLRFDVHGRQYRGENA